MTAPRRELTYNDRDVDAGQDDGPTKREPAHDITTCDQPICAETRRIIAGRGERQKTPK